MTRGSKHIQPREPSKSQKRDGSDYKLDAQAGQQASWVVPPHLRLRLPWTSSPEGS